MRCATNIGSCVRPAQGYIAMDDRAWIPIDVAHQSQQQYRSPTLLAPLGFNSVH